MQNQEILFFAVIYSYRYHKHQVNGSKIYKFLLFKKIILSVFLSICRYTKRVKIFMYKKKAHTQPLKVFIVYILIYVCGILFLPFELWSSCKTNKNSEFAYKQSRIVRAYKLDKTHTVNLKKLSNNDNEEYVLVPKKLVGEKLQRYFARLSKAVVLMSCCQYAQVHRRCLQDMFHGQENGYVPYCPDCKTFVDKKVFAQSRAQYLYRKDRVLTCAFCHTSLQ